MRLAIWITTTLLLLSLSSPIYAQSVEEIYIGGLFPLNESYGNAAIDRKTAFTMAIDEINANSSLLQGYKLVPIYGNTQGDPDIGVSEAERLISEGAIVLVGAAKSSVSAAIASGPSKEHQIPMISYSSTAISLSNEVQYPYFNRVAPSDFYQGIAKIDIVRHFGWDKIVTLGTSDIYSSGNILSQNTDSLNPVGLDIFEQEAQSYGIDIVHSVKLSDIDSQVDIELNTIKETGVRVIYLSASVSDSIKILEAAYNQHVSSKEGYIWIGSDAVVQESVFASSDKIKSVLQGSIGTRPHPGIGLRYDHFLNLWQTCNSLNDTVYPNCGNSIPNVYASYTYDATWLSALAINEIVSTSRDPNDGLLLNTIIRETSFQGVTAEIDLDSNGDTKGTYEIVNLQDKSFVRIGTWSDEVGLEFSQKIYWDGISDSNIPPGIGNPLYRNQFILPMLQGLVISGIILWLLSRYYSRSLRLYQR